MKPIELPRRFVRTAAALAVFDAGAAARSAVWDSAETERNIDAAVLAEREALELVQRAFHEDTIHINTLENCLRMDEKFIRRLIEDDGKPSAFFNAGLESKRRGENILKSQLTSLRPGTPQYEDFIAGYDYNHK